MTFVASFQVGTRPAQLSPVALHCNQEVIRKQFELVMLYFMIVKESSIGIAHLLSSIVTFGGGSLYLLLQTILTKKTTPTHSTYCLWVFRLILWIGSLLSFASSQSSLHQSQVLYHRSANSFVTSVFSLHNWYDGDVEGKEVL